jgi:eukaryotic-like serine/threonine-protein kinase
MSTASAHTNAAESLEGLLLDSGWQVRDRIQKPPGATGGFFSVCYQVTKDGQECFLKAFNFAQFLVLAHAHGGTRSIVDVVSDMLDAYKYERDLSSLCQKSRVTKVAFVREAGEQIVSGYAITVVPYLIFDVADGGDVRSHLSFASNLEAGWKLRSLHSVAVGLQQLHRIDVSHQDLKPSNVLLFGDESRIGDLGRSTCLAIPSPLRDCTFAGDLTYAPPEVLYGVHEPEWRKRSFACDTYLLGSLIVFYFSGLTMTALLRKHLPDPVSWEYHRGTYADVESYVLNAYSATLDEFERSVHDRPLAAELRNLVTHLCHPLPTKRAYGPPSVAGTAVDLERVVSRLDFLSRKFAR